MKVTLLLRNHLDNARHVDHVMKPDVQRLADFHAEIGRIGRRPNSTSWCVRELYDKCSTVIPSTLDATMGSMGKRGRSKINMNSSNTLNSACESVSAALKPERRGRRT